MWTTYHAYTKVSNLAEARVLKFLLKNGLRTNLLGLWGCFTICIQVEPCDFVPKYSVLFTLQMCAERSKAQMKAISAILIAIVISTLKISENYSFCFSVDLFIIHAVLLI